MVTTGMSRRIVFSGIVALLFLESSASAIEVIGHGSYFGQYYNPLRYAPVAVAPIYGCPTAAVAPPCGVQPVVACYAPPVAARVAYAPAYAPVRPTYPPVTGGYPPMPAATYVHRPVVVAPAASWWPQF